MHKAIERFVVFEFLPWADAGGSDQEQERLGGRDFLGELREPEARAQRDRRQVNVGSRLKSFETHTQRLGQRLVLGMERQKNPQACLQAVRQPSHGRSLSLKMAQLSVVFGPDPRAYANAMGGWAKLRVDRSDLRPVSLESTPVPVGALAVAIGAEAGTPTAALGVVSCSEGSWRSLRGGEIDARIELDLRLRRSAEGGFAIDPAGRAAGACWSSHRRRLHVWRRG